MSRAARRAICLAAIVSVFVFAARSQGRSQGRSAPPTRDAPPTRLVDLTHTLDRDFPFIPIPGITFPFSMTPIATMEKNGVAANRWDIHEHIGTQIDAPNHFVLHGAGLEALPAETLVVPLAVIDISARAERDPDTAVTVADLTSWEQRHGRFADRSAVFMYSGWDARIRDAKKFINADASNTMHFPGFSVAAVEFLLRRRISGVGVDTLSIDPGIDKTYRTHRVWLGGGKWAVEAVANLAQVPATGATVFVGAPKVRGATGGPVRLLAVW